MDIQPLFAVEPPPVSRSPLVWPGGKWYCRSQIIPYLLRGATRAGHVVSPFLGGGHIELELAARGVRVWGSDIYMPLVCLWNQVLNRPQEFAEALRVAVGGYPMTAAKANEAMKLWHALGPESTEEEIAVGLLTTTKLGYGGMIGRHKAHPYGREGYCKKFWNVDQHFHERLCRFHAPHLTCEEMDYRDALARLPHVPAYLDPPYRIPTSLYGERGEVHTAFDHDEFAETMLRRDSPWAISYNDIPEVRDIFGGECDFYNINAKYSIGKHLPCRDSQELLIMHDWRL